jgi:Na+/melibiose symporter-like transporter
MDWEVLPAKLGRYVPHLLFPYINFFFLFFLTFLQMDRKNVFYYSLVGGLRERPAAVTYRHPGGA